MRPAPPRLRIPTFALAAAALVVGFLVLRTAGPVSDPDTYWHLASGRLVAADHVLVGPDPWSPFTHGDWIRHQWLSDLAFFGMAVAGGLSAVAWLLPGMTALAIAALYVALRHRASLLLSLVLLGLGFVAMSGSLSLRPQVLPFAATAVTVDAWLRWRQDRRAPWWLLPLTWLWASWHGLWVLSPAIGGAVVLGHLLDRMPWRQLTRPTLVAVGCAAAGALTPIGPVLLTVPLRIRPITPYIQEWQRPGVGSIAMWAVLLTVAAVVLTWLRSRRRPNAGHVILLAGALVLTLSASRTVSVGGVIAIIVAADVLAAAWGQPPEPVGRRERLMLIGGLLGGLTLSWLTISAGPPQVGSPTGVDAGLSSAAAGTVVCTEYDAGGWLLWAHPGLIPTLDGRTELYTTAQLVEGITFATAGRGWEDTVERYRCPLALATANDPLHRAFVDSGRGTVVADNGDWVLLRVNP